MKAPKAQHCEHLQCLVAQLCPTLCDPMDCSPTGSSVHGILQARILGWVAMPFSRGSSQPRDRTQVSHTTGRFFTIWATREARQHLGLGNSYVWEPVSFTDGGSAASLASACLIPVVIPHCCSDHSCLQTLPSKCPVLGDRAQTG